MADVVGKIPKSKSIRRRIKKSKSRKRNFHLIKRDVENDEMHDSKTNNKRNSPQLDIKSKSYDHSERKQEINKHFSNISEDRSVSFRSRVNQRFGTSSHYPRSFHDDRLSGNNCDTNMHIPLPRDEDREIGDKRFVSFNQSTFSHDDEFVASLLEKIDYLRNQVDFLNQENERLKFGFTEMRNNDLSTEVNISFLNKELEERFVPILSELATDLIQGHISVCDLRAFLSTKKNSFNGAEDFRELPEESLFALDNSTSEIKEDPHVPVYETSFSEILETEEDKNESEAQKSASKKRFRRSCYNCSEDHVISQCPYKIDYYKVANCKKQAKKQQAASSTRYHLQESGGSDFKPGIISDTLREALGLRPNQIPLYIYRMRLISYPPGWLEEATVETSGINVYDSKGYVLKNEKDEMDIHNMNGPRVEYDADKFIDFPGFNVPLPPDVIDECYAYKLPPMQPHHMRTYVEQTIPKLDRPNRRKKLKLSNDNPSKTQRLEEDMDLDEDLGDTHYEFIPPLPQESLPPPPSEDIIEPPENGSEPPLEEKHLVILKDSDSGTNTPASDSGPNTPASDSAMDSLKPVVERFKLKNSDSIDDSASLPSLKELEEMKKQLVKELGIVSECSSPDGQEPSASDVEDLNANCDSKGSFVFQDSSNDPSSFSDSSFTSNVAKQKRFSGGLKRSNSTRSQSKQVTLGTPSLSRHSSYQKLPDYDNFSKNVTAHVNFENLPNSTGTYEKMKSVIKKVKETFNSLL